MRREIKIGDDSHSVSLINTPQGRHIIVDGTEAHLSVIFLGDDSYRFTIGDHTVDATAVTKGENVYIEAFGRTFTTTVLDPVEQAHAASEAGDPSAKAPMPGVVVELHAAVGDSVIADQPLLTIESMKLLTVIRAAGGGTVAAINYDAGDTFNKGVVLVQVQAQESDDA